MIFCQNLQLKPSKWKQEIGSKAGQPEGSNNSDNQLKEDL
jgi:hypothetical protein